MLSSALGSPVQDIEYNLEAGPEKHLKNKTIPFIPIYSTYEFLMFQGSVMAKNFISGL